MEASHKAVASIVYETIPVHVLSDARCQSQRYQVSLNKYLEPESNATGPLVMLRECKENGLRQKGGHETGTNHQNVIKDSESVHIMRKFKEQKMLTSPKQGSSVVFALLTTACVATVTFEALLSPDRRRVYSIPRSNTVVIDSLLKTVTTPTPAAVMLNKAQNEIRQNEQKPKMCYITMQIAIPSQAISAEDVGRSVHTTELTDCSIVVKTHGMQYQEHIFQSENINGHTIRPEDRHIQGGRWLDSIYLFQHYWHRSMDKQQEYKTAALKCKVDQSLAQPSWTPVLQEHTAIVISPQVSMNIQQIVIVKNMDISQSTRLAAENQQGKQVERIARSIISKSCCSLHLLQSSPESNPGFSPATLSHPYIVNGKLVAMMGVAQHQDWTIHNLLYFTIHGGELCGFILKTWSLGRSGHIPANERQSDQVSDMHNSSTVYNAACHLGSGNLSTQKSEKQARTECMDSKVDMQDMCEVQKGELMTYLRSLQDLMSASAGGRHCTEILLN
ncbi:hypothetical protein HD554DRAFT_2040150 [Boletus coccyginus]|nr:hypothetical protein HD554DRAFT_2040150 [Boletus coccyginus]